jgi:hypothetical protein
MRQRSNLIYLATPYTDSCPEVQTYRFHRVTGASALLLRNGVFNFSPITQSHEQHMSHELPGTWDFWSKVDLEFLSRCDEIFVLADPGWQDSVGVTAEIEFAKKNNIPVTYFLYDDEYNVITKITEQRARKVLQWTQEEKKVISTTRQKLRCQSCQE